MTRDKQRVSYICEPCNFTTFNKTDYERHLSRRKHHENVKYYEKTIPKPDPNMCSSCHKIFKYRTSIYKHKTVCPGPQPPQLQPNFHSSPSTSISTSTSTSVAIDIDDNIISPNDNVVITKEMFMTLLKNNQEMMKMIKSLSEHPNVNNTTNNTINNNCNNKTNCHNNTFNMNLFLNEKCKDAMNMKDFVNSIQLNLTDLENVGRLGYVEGMSNILIDNLQKTDVYKRPVHCSDVKRETLYVKDDNKWEREGPDRTKLVNAVLAVEHKNVALVSEWAKAHPLSMNSRTRDNEMYMKLSKVATDGEKEGNIAKVIRKIAKRVAIEKEL